MRADVQRLGARSAADDLTGLTFATVCALAFGTAAIFAKFAYREGADAVPLLASRFALAALLLLGYQVARRKPVVPDRATLARLSFLGVCYAFEASLFFIALEYAPAGTISLIFYSFPLWTTIISLATGLERFRWGLAGALALGSAGVLLIFTVASGDLTGPLFALAAAVAVAIYFALAQVLARGVPVAFSSLWSSTAAAVVLTVVWLATGQKLPAGAFPYSGALGVMTAIAFVMLLAAIAKIGASKTSIAAMLEPVATVVLAAIFLDEVITGRVAIGAVMILATLPILAVSGRRKATVPAADSP